MSAQLAGLHISPNDGGLPGLPAASTLVGGLMTYGFLACVIGIILGVIVWVTGSHTSNPHHASRGRTGVVVSAFGAVLIASSVGLVNFFSAVHLA